MPTILHSGVECNGHSMTGRLRKALVCSPLAAGWEDARRSASWHELGFHHAPDFKQAQRQHQFLCNELHAGGIELFELSPDDSLTLDAVYTHDASLPTDFGVILMRPGKLNRIAEANQHRSAYETMGVPILGAIEAPGATEAGDMVWLDAKTLLVGRGYRTNESGIAQLRTMLSDKGVVVLSAPLPHGAGSATCLHLMSLISLLDERTAVVDFPWLAVETVELLKSRGFELIQIDDSERETLACNVLSLGEKRLLAIEENRKTNVRLQQAGFEVRTFPGSEICINGSGGPTCLTRPLLRE